MYNWRKISNDERARLLRQRKSRKFAWHAPPHLKYEGNVRFLLTAACYEHKHIIGVHPERMAECEKALIELCDQYEVKLFAWCVLPNHYHLLIQTERIREFQDDGLGGLHGSSAYLWNTEDNARKRTVWYRSFERPMKTNGHFWASMNYVHHNPVKHGYVRNWQDWAYSSARNYLESVGEARATAIWKEFPILDYGEEWDFD